MKTTAILVRHGQTSWNIQEKFQGMSDIPLTDLGRKQAGFARDALKSVEIDQAFTSPLIRASETCNIILENHPIKAKIEKDFRELSAGKWEGYNSKDIERLFPGELAIWNSTPTKVHMEGGETLEEARIRAINAFNKHLSQNKGKTILMVSHMVCLSTILLTIAGLPLDYIWKHPISNAAINIIEVDCNDNSANIIEWNRTDHIPKEFIRTPMFKNR